MTTKTYNTTNTPPAAVMHYDSDSAHAADAAFALGGTGGAFIFMMSAYLLLAPAAMMMAVR